MYGEPALLATPVVCAPQAYNGAVREQLADLQRGRMLGATFDVVAQRGAGA